MYIHDNLNVYIQYSKNVLLGSCPYSTQGCLIHLKDVYTWMSYTSLNPQILARAFRLLSTR